MNDKSPDSPRRWGQALSPPSVPSGEIWDHALSRSCSHSARTSTLSRLDNLVLGGRRADGVMVALARFGMSQQNIRTTSREEIDAVGVDEDTWARDRRVDVTLDH